MAPSGAAADNQPPTFGGSCRTALVGTGWWPVCSRWQLPPAAPLAGRKGSRPFDVVTGATWDLINKASNGYKPIRPRLADRARHPRAMSCQGCCLCCPPSFLPCQLCHYLHMACPVGPVGSCSLYTSAKVQYLTNCCYCMVEKL